MPFNEVLNRHLLRYVLGFDVVCKSSKVNSPAITICCIDINSKVKQELDNVVVTGAHCVVQGCDALVVRSAGVLHLATIHHKINTQD